MVKSGTLGELPKRGKMKTHATCSRISFLSAEPLAKSIPVSQHGTARKDRAAPCGTILVQRGDLVVMYFVVVVQQSTCDQIPVVAT